jgi:hypothetical protein
MPALSGGRRYPSIVERLGTAIEACRKQKATLLIAKLDRLAMLDKQGAAGIASTRVQRSPGPPEQGRLEAPGRVHRGRDRQRTQRPCPARPQLTAYARVQASSTFETMNVLVTTRSLTAGVRSGVSVWPATVRSSSEQRSEPSPRANGRVSDQWLTEERNRRPEKR